MLFDFLLEKFSDLVLRRVLDVRIVSGCFLSSFIFWMKYGCTGKDKSRGRRASMELPLSCLRLRPIVNGQDCTWLAVKLCHAAMLSD